MQIIHGLAEHPDRYERLARALNAAGLIVWAHHRRVHGSNPVPGTRWHFADDDGWRALADDAHAVAERLLNTWKGLPLVLFTHPMGSFVGLRVVADRGASYAREISRSRISERH